MDADNAPTEPWKSLRDFHKHPPPSLLVRLALRGCNRELRKRKRALPDFEGEPTQGERRVKVEVLYVAACPSHPAAVKLVKDVLAAQGIATEVDEVLVKDEQMAGELQFPGSPTIRIDGRDVAGESNTAKNFALSCRLYPGSKQVGLPPAEMVHRAVLNARQRGRQ